MGRRSAVLTPQGKKEALARLKSNTKEAKTNLKVAKLSLGDVTRKVARAVREHASYYKKLARMQEKATHAITRAQTLYDVAVSSFAELKARATVKIPAPVKAKVPEVKAPEVKALETKALEVKRKVGRPKKVIVTA